MLKTILKLEHERLTAAALTDSIKLSELINRFDDSDYCKKYLSAETKWMTYRHIIEQGMNLNERHNKELAESIAESTVYDSFELNNLLKLIASTRINYLIRPNFTLEKFIFRNELTKPMDEIMIRLDYFAENEYLLSGIKDVFENLRPSNPREIYTVSTFAKITENYDESFISELNTYEFAALLEPLGRLYFSHGFSGIPVNAISIFLSDKNLVQAAALFENNLQGVEYLLSPDMIIVELEKIIDPVNPASVSAKPDDIFSVDDELEYISDDDLSEQIAGSSARIRREAVPVVPANWQPTDPVSTWVVTYGRLKWISDNAVMQVRPADEGFSSTVSKGCEEHQLTCAETPMLLRPLTDLEHSKAQESMPEVLKMMTGFWTFCCFLALVAAAFKQR